MSEKLSVKSVYYDRQLKRVENVSEIEFVPADDVLSAIARIEGYTYKDEKKNDVVVTGEQVACGILNDSLRDAAAKAARAVPTDGILRSSVAKFIAPLRANKKFAALEKDKAAQTAAICAEVAKTEFLLDSLIEFDAAQRAAGASDAGGETEEKGETPSA